MKTRNKILTGLTALVLSAGITTKASSEQYVYTDDFSTNKVIHDSYNHDGVYPQPPEMGYTPFLTLQNLPYFPRALGFFPGYVTIDDATIKYKMPLYSIIDGITAGTLKFDVADNHMTDLTPSHIKVSISKDGNEWTCLHESHIQFPTPVVHFDFDLPSTNSQNQYLMINGLNISLDNLSIQLEADNIVQTEGKSWGDIKALYRDN